MDVQLTIEKPDGGRSSRRFTEQPITLGSDQANHVVVDDETVASHQLIIFSEHGEWVVRNLADGPAVRCQDRPLAAGVTQPLGAKAVIRVGVHSFQWNDGAPEPAFSPFVEADAVPAQPSLQPVVVPDLDLELDRPLNADPEPEFPEVPEKVTARSAEVAINGFRRMVAFRVHSVEVRLARPPATPPRASVRIVPHLPGCVVSPTSVRFQSDRLAPRATFSVTPVVEGHCADGWVEVTWEGRQPMRVSLPVRVGHKVSVVWTALLGAVVGALSAFADEPVRARAGRLLEQAPFTSDAALLGYGLAAGLLVASAALFLRGRPRQGVFSNNRQPR